MKTPRGLPFNRPRYQIAAAAALAVGLVAGWSHIKPSGDGAGTKRPTTLEGAWQAAAAFLFNDANNTFNAARLEPSQERERELGKAVTLLNVQPRTVENIAKARRIFETLSSGEDHDEPAIFSDYYLARIYERYETPPEPRKARTYYLKLLEKHAGHPVAEFGASAMVLMALYDNITPEERGRRFAGLEALGASLETSSGRRDYHLNMGNAYIDFEASREKALNHLLAADAETISLWQVESATWISIAELARDEGRDDLAEAYYKRFLSKYRRDNRHYSIERRLGALKNPKNMTADER